MMRALSTLQLSVRTRQHQFLRNHAKSLPVIDRAFQHIVKNTCKGVVNINRFQKELEIIHGGKDKQIVHALVAYKPRIERIPADANTVAYQRSVATLSTDGQFLVQPWNTRLAGEVRRLVTQVNGCMFAYIAPESTEPGQPVTDHHHDHTCFCCRECDSEGDDVCFQDGGDDGWSMEAVYGESTNWTDVPKMQAMSPESPEKLKAGIQKLRKLMPSLSCHVFGGSMVK